jgi:integrase
VLQAALNYAAAVERFDAPKLGKAERVPKKRIRFLSRDQETRLLGSYAPHVRPVAEALCFQGLRVGEALRVDWAHVDWAGNSLFVAETKTGDPRSVTMHLRSARPCTGSGWAVPGGGPGVPEQGRPAVR